MSQNKQILIISSDKPSETKVMNALNQSGFMTKSCQFKELSATLNSGPKFDVLLFNMTGLDSEGQMRTCLKLAEKIKDHPATKSIRLLSIGIAKDLLKQQETHHFDDLIFGEIRLPSVISRVRAQFRLNTMLAEFNRRKEIAQIYNCQTLTENPLSEHIENASILITGRPNGYSTLEATLAPIGTLVGTLSLPTAKEYLSRQSFDMIIINGGRMPARFFEFVEEIRKSPGHINTPILLVTHTSKLGSSYIAYEAGFTDIIDAPVNRNELILRTKSLIKERRFRDSMAQSYLSARHIPTNDALTGLYTYSFYREHLDQLISDHNVTKRNFTLINIALENIEHINDKHGFAAGDIVLRQVSEILMSIIRGEDLASRTSGHQFTLTLPDTDEEHAMNVLSRVEGILKQTEFICETDALPMKVELAAQIISSNGESTAAELFARANNEHQQANNIIAA